MKKHINHVIWGIGLSISLLISGQAMAQYPGGGYGGGYGNGYGGRQGGLANSGIPSSSPRPQALPFGNMANQQTEWMKNNLNLTKEQAKAVKKLNNTYADKQKEETQGLIPASGPPSDAVRQQIREVMAMLNDEKEEELKPILTPEQWTTYQTKRDSLTKAQGIGRPTVQRQPK